jgi:hypothetical protein
MCTHGSARITCTCVHMHIVTELVISYGSGDTKTGMSVAIPKHELHLVPAKDVLTWRGSLRCHGANIPLTH